ncbi:MAG TPA: hypothetical protein VEB67_03720 [Nitrososphaerales archaeon]|nr:hypothetical protein [Nitrososphaerales archaeon]
MTGATALSAGDFFGFAALFMIAVAASLMLLRSELLKLTKNLALVRVLHLSTSTIAGLFLVLHISYLFLPPVSTGLIVGYAAVIVSAVAWLTGTAFLQRVKDSLFFHGVLSSILIPLALIHAATSGANISTALAEVLLAGSAAVVFANAGLHIKRALGSPKR